jgi:uncharacterized protein YfdQ (DUF2303 family)
MTEHTEAADIAQLAKATVAPVELQPATIYAVLDGEGGIQISDTEKYSSVPQRTKATRTVTDAASFVAYLSKHASESSEVWADTPNSTVVAVIDAPTGAGQASGWEGHNVRLSLEKSKPWLAWEAVDGLWFNQLEFADFIETRASDVRVPAAADLLELAQHFSAKRAVSFESSERMNDGSTKLAYSETTTARAGQKGSIDIPERLQLVLRPYVGGPAYFVWARFRYRLNGPVLALGVVLDRPQEILDAAFADIVIEIRDGKEATEAKSATDDAPSVLGSPGHKGITQPIFYGRP